ncbi:LysR family transcriptional regulator [Paracoccus sp. R12_1]|uniref:LysR family transcriptional regulator n=1 Tax=Paracoccus maritimus TaxID=2933292 RepID=A0ABT2K8S1_9RHOB|nr:MULTISPECIES: LysR family transcriptional regulator [unclassified Paracoccus (in: a-proteobacteria)]MBO9454500.1 LysR family transcriptional regulator [Paracoccus sp. R12_2]MBO9486054.1 LysR family transcriptional regulator [Paracoccus sp. R12_1]MCT4332902.1 LysR family transcriptional regulator [Paracoccus sp. YLB-12]PHQ66322.1 MAG: LysR family transcriptional regulator [Paracoccus sp. (in: a-proteobacteria)]
MSYLESLRVFVRVVELGSITAGGRDLRLSPAVASNRIKDLENRFGVRLLNRTTRKLTPTEIGRAFYDHARRVIDTLDEAEAMVSSFSGKPQGVIRLTAPLGLGRRLIAPLIPPFCDANPGVDFRLRLSDRNVNIVEDAIDLAFFLGEPADSALKWRKIADAPRVLVASPEYLAEHGTPRKPEELADHNCLLLRYPRSPEYFWVLQTDQGQQKMMINGRYDTDDGDVLRSWALGGHGIANRPLYEVSEDLASGRLIKILPEAPPLPAQFGCLTPHRRLQDPKVRMFADFAVRELKKIF